VRWSASATRYVALLVDPVMKTHSNCVFCSRAGCMMETPARNKPGNRCSSVFGDGDTRETDVGGLF
jgi:hypothetical protein